MITGALFGIDAVSAPSTPPGDKSSDTMTVLRKIRGLRMVGGFDFDGDTQRLRFRALLDEAARCRTNLPKINEAVLKQHGDQLRIAMRRQHHTTPEVVYVDAKHAIIWTDIPDHRAFDHVCDAIVDAFGDKDAALRLGQIVSLAPLTMADPADIVPTPKVQQVRVTSLSVQTAGRRPSRVTIESEDVLQELQRRPDLHVRRGILSAARLTIQIAGFERPEHVELLPPITLALNWTHLSAPVIINYLVRRGFVLTHTELA